MSLIPKPYKWEGVLTNTHPIALVETARKILSKVLSDRISSACSVFDVLKGDNFSVLKGTTMQSPIFAIGSVIEDALEKNRELWLVLQDMQKAYDSSYDGFWVKRQESVCGYKLDSRFVANTGCAKSWAGLTSFLTAGVFVNNMIWIGSSQAATQHILNVATKKGEPYRYLGIFLSTEGLSKSSLAKARLDVQFFTNLVLRKAISYKQFSYLVSAVLHSIIAYRTQFSFVPISVCAKWDTMIRKSLKSKSGLPLDFSNNTIHHPSLYRLKSFEQIQAESKLAAVVCFANSSCEFDVVCNRLLKVDSNCLSLFTDGSLCGLGTLDMKADAAVFFKDIDLGLGVEVSGLVSSIMTELQAIALALECVPPSRSVNLFSDSQAALNACKSELMLERPDFRNRCWVERHHIFNVIHRKNLDVNWIKVRGHSGVLGNECANTLARAATSSDVCLPYRIDEHFLKAGGTVVSGNSRHFVHGVFHSIYYAHWEVGSGSRVLVDSLRIDVDWFRSCSVWHPDSYLAAGFTSVHTAGSQTYFMKALHYHLPVAVQKWLYNKEYPSVMCLFCSDVEISNYVFSCPFDAGDHVFLCLFDAGDYARLINTYASLLSACTSDAVVSTAICKGFVFNEWYCESLSVFKNSKTVAQNIVAFVHEFCLAFCDDIWLVRVKHRAVIEKGGLVSCDDSISISVSGLSLVLSSSVVRLLGIADALGVSFGFCKSSLFFSGVSNLVSVHIGA
ncbi:hypothetical protein G9A89_016408 [Geosiphon pyriformis]|nr:hypothetical protein G9A89_016408 [Geosiphon pyriformis]